VGLAVVAAISGSLLGPWRGHGPAPQAQRTKADEGKGPGDGSPACGDLLRLPGQRVEGGEPLEDLAGQQGDGDAQVDPLGAGRDPARDHLGCEDRDAVAVVLADVDVAHPKQVGQGRLFHVVAVDLSGGLRRARGLEALGFLQITLAAADKTTWTGGFGLVA
jgi:hypothetical protein